MSQSTSFGKFLGRDTPNIDSENQALPQDPRPDLKVTDSIGFVRHSEQNISEISRQSLG